MTVLDLNARPRDSGGLNNIATVVAELALDGHLSAADLSAASGIYPSSVVRRLGWLLDRVATVTGAPELANALDRALVDFGGRTADLIDPAGRRRGHANSRWRLFENSDGEPDR